MRKLVNLGSVRKDKARAAKRVTADENAVRFGRTKGQKMQDAKRAEDAARLVDGHKLEK